MARRREAVRIKLQVEKKKPGFGTIKDFLFKEQVLKKVREDLPKELTDFSSAKGPESYVGVDSPAYRALSQYMAACFVSYEEEINRLNKEIIRLKRLNRKLAQGNDVVSLSVRTITLGSAQNVEEAPPSPFKSPLSLPVYHGHSCVCTRALTPFPLPPPPLPFYHLSGRNARCHGTPKISPRRF